MTIKQLSIFVENRPGRMAEITEALASRGIDIRALSLADTSDFGLLRLIVSNPDSAAVMLQEAGIMVRLSDVIALSVLDKPGEFSRAVRCLADAGVNIEYLYAFLSRTDGEAVVIVRVDNLELGIEILSKNGVRLLGPEQAYSL